MSANPRHRTVAVNVGGVNVGRGHPVVVQSMTNTDTVDVQATVNQVMALANSGSELVRVTVNNDESAAAVPKIAETLYKFGVRVPVIGDFHYNGHLLLKKYPDMAGALAGSLSPVIFGFFAQRGFWIAPFLVTAGMLVTGALVWMFLIDPEKSVLKS